MHDLQARNARLAALSARLEALNPLAVLERGYAIAMDPSGRIVRDASQLSLGDLLSLRLARGEAEAEVRAVRLQPLQPTTIPARAGAPEDQEPR